MNQIAKPEFSRRRPETSQAATLVAPTPGNRPLSSPGRQSDAPKGDSILFEIAPGWGIGCDSLQWMLMRQRQGRVRGWYPIAFVATERRILERVIGERAVPVTPEGRARLHALPATFREFKAAGFTLTALETAP